jgi:ribosomal protein S18 acetylase RimI-like enzyme
MVLLNGLSDEYNAADIDMVPPDVRPLFSLLVNAPGHLMIREIAVFPRFRGKGVGEALMIPAESIAEGQGFPGLALNVHESNHAAQRLYLRHGFEPVATCKVHSHPAYPAGSRWYTMTRTF